MNYTIELPGEPKEEGRFTVELPQQAQQRTAGESLARGIGLSARGIVTGVAGIPNMLGDAVNILFNYGILGANKLTGAEIPYLEKPSQATQRLMTRAGLPEPETAGERVMYEGIVPAVIGGGGLAKLAYKGAEKLAPSVTQSVLETLGKEQGMQAVSNAAGGAAGAVTGEMGGGPVAQFVASVLGGATPALAKAGGAAATRGLARGGDAEGYNQRLDDFTAAGVNPALHQVAGTGRTEAAGALFSRAPGGVGRMARFADQQASDMQAKVNAIADKMMPNTDATSAGVAIDKGLKGFVSRFRAEQNFLYDKLDQYLPKDTRVDVGNTLKTLGEINAEIPGAPALSDFFKNAKLESIKRAALKDTATPADIAEQLAKAQAELDGLVASRNRFAQQGGQFAGYANAMTQGADNAYPVPGMPRVPARLAPQLDRAAEAAAASGEAAALARNKTPEILRAETRVRDLENALEFSQGKLPYEAVKKLRTLVGERIENNSLVDDIPRSKWKAVYAALSNDMGNAAKAAGPEAEAALVNANTFTKAGHDRIESVLDRVSGGPTRTPEGIYKAAIPSESRDGGTIIKTVMDSLTPEERAEVSSATIRRMGRAKPGAQNEMGDKFSTETFLTNWGNFSDDAKRALFPDGEVRSGMDDIAKAAANIRGAAQRYANPSGSAQAVANYSAGSGLALSALSGNFGTAGVILGAIAASNAGARLMTNPNFVKWVGKTTKVSPGAMPAQINLLLHEASGWPEEDQQAVVDFVKSTKGQAAPVAQ